MKICNGVSECRSNGEQNLLKTRLRLETHFVDIRKWIKEEGFLEIVGKMKIAESSKKDNTGKSKIKKSTKDYKKLYFELKQKYDELLKYVKELTDSV